MSPAADQPLKMLASYAYFATARFGRQRRASRMDAHLARPAASEPRRAPVPLREGRLGDEVIPVVAQLLD